MGAHWELSGSSLGALWELFGSSSQLRVFRANAVEEQAEATEELISQLTKAHTHQMETLIESTTEAMKEMLNLIKGYSRQRKAPNSDSKDKKKKCEDKRNKF